MNTLLDLLKFEHEPASRHIITSDRGWWIERLAVATVGILPWDKVQSEVGYDTLFPSSNPVFFLLNGKLCTPESSLFKGSPAIGEALQPGGKRTLWTTQLDVDIPLGR